MAQNASSIETLSGEYTFPKLEKVIFGPGSVARLAEQADRLGGRRAFIITGNTLANKTDLVDRVRSVLGSRCAGVYSGSKQHVPREAVLEAAEQARSAGADLLISFGGGSPVDLAKMVALCLAQNVRNETELDAYRIRFQYPDRVDIPAVPNVSVPQIAVTTTLSAGEFTAFAGCTDPVRQAKDLYYAEHLNPKVCILDPEMTVATPSWLWGSTGVRSIDHCVEEVYSRVHQPFADALALRALAMLFDYLPRASAEPDNLAARGQCQVAAWMAVYSLPSVQVGLSHGIGHQLGARCNVPHGVTSCIMLPVVMDFNRPVTADRQALLAPSMGVDTRGLSDEEAATAAANNLRALVRELGIKDRLSDWGVTEADLPGIAADALEDLVVATNPRPVTSTERVVELLRRVL
ncbi:MAG TPA: iron-containing alcohol dehydrogenase [Dehalococcoidia bacterium]|nr:iron-containing alcohol dehydrogenase [Dehalococcoidia bacterium]